MRIPSITCIGLIGLITTIFAITLPTVAAETGAAGLWEGQIYFTNTEAKIELQIQPSVDHPSGALILPGRNGQGLPLEKLAITGSNISFEINNGRAVAGFKGTINPDGKTIRGDFVQAGQTFVFELNRKLGELTAKAPGAGKDFPKQ